MTYAAWITKLRAEAKDLAKPMRTTFTGDGVATRFWLTDAPVLEGSYLVQVNSVQKAENTDYTIDRELGLITFNAAPSNGHAVVVDYKHVHLTDASWLQIINETIEDMEGEFFKEVVDDSWETSVANQASYNAPTKCIDVVNAWYRTADDSTIRWTMLSSITNYRYSKDENKVHLGRPLTADSYPMKLHYLKGYTLGDETTDTLDMQEAYERVLKLGCMWRYYDYRLADRVEITTKVSEERTITPLQNIQALSSHYRTIYLKEKGRKKPTKPMRVLSTRLADGGTP